MSRSLFYTIVFLLLSISIHCQDKDGMTFDIEDFNEKASMVEWLYMYDAIAWWTSDSVVLQDKNEIARLGNEWFCFQSSDSNWHAVYGKYENSVFDLVFHYFVDTAYNVSRIYEPVDTFLTHSYSRAILNAYAELKPISDSFNLRFNHYISRNADESITVWIFPAFQPNGLAVYGGEFIYTYNPSGTKLLVNDSHYQGQFRGAQVGEQEEILLVYTELEKPSLGTVFFTWYYKSYFNSIRIENKNYITTTIDSGDGQYSWFHIEKD